MKKAILILAAAVAVQSFAADRTFAEIGTALNSLANIKEKSKYVDGLTESEYRGVLDHVIAVASTNVAAGNYAFGHPVNLRWRLWCSCRQLSAEYDSKLAAAGIECDPTFAYEHLPMCCENYMKNKANESVLQAKAYFISLCLKNKTHRLYTYSMPEIVNLAATLSAIGRCKYYMRDNYKESILKAATKPIKRRIREMGGSFVVGPDGKNPVQDAIDELSSALNAPKMGGAKQWVAKWFPDHVWVEPKWMSDAEVAKLKNDVLFGDVDFGYNQVCLLEAHLGTEAYNAFVKEYNGSGK